MTLARWLCLTRNFSIIICILNVVVRSQYNGTNTTTTQPPTTPTTLSTLLVINTTIAFSTTTGNVTFEQKVNQTIAQVEQFHEEIVMQQWCTTVTLSAECPNSNISFWLYTKNMAGPYLLDETHMDSIIHAPFIPNVPIKILLHGYAGNKSYTPNREIRPRYIAKGYNVISIDYRQAVPHPCYIQASNNMVRVGRCFARFISTLINANLKTRQITMADMHVVGYCLGAQVAGRAGAILTDQDLQFTRISALDPVLPLFHGMLNHISSYTAKFVDAAHTNFVVFGKLVPVGHVDFYFNGAVFQGGACRLTDRGCFTGMAAAYFAESILDQRIPLCGYDLFTMTKFAIMGEKAVRDSTGLYLVLTNKIPPYGRGCVKDILHKEYDHYWVNSTHYVSF